MSRNEFWEEELRQKPSRKPKTQRRNLRKRERSKKLSKMNAGNVEKETDKLENFVGIFDIKMLPDLKIVSYPCSLIVLTNQHWISIFMAHDSIEIMDSMGYLSNRKFSKFLRIFLSAHLIDKNLSLTPKIQADESNLCALYSICFLYYRTLGCGNLCDFCKLFTSDYDQNCAAISQMYENIRKINN